MDEAYKDDKALCKWLRDNSSGAYRLAGFAADRIETLSAQLRNVQDACDEAECQRDDLLDQLATVNAERAETRDLRKAWVELDDLRQALQAEIVELKKKLNWQNMPNRNEPLRGGYEFYVNEEWSRLRSAPLDEDPGWNAALRKIRIDCDDERVRVRRVLDDDAILQELGDARDALVEFARAEYASLTQEG